MSHATTGMSSMKNPTKGLRKIVTDIQNARAVTKNDVSFVAPFLDGEVLDLDVSSTRSGTGLVDHGNCSLIVNEKRRMFIRM